MSALDSFLREARERVESFLDKALPAPGEPPAALHEAMRYAVLSGGKRLRPALAYGAALAVEGECESVSPVAAAVELVHAYSLVHDDLPAMDDDLERRGQPTVHVKFGEAQAILVGDALLTEAFAVLARAGAPVELIGELAEAASSRGLVGGQSDDLDFPAAPPDLQGTVSIHERKTSRLFRFSTGGAARMLGAAASAVQALERFGSGYGMAFQLADDLRDAGSDECSILAVLSPEEARERARGELDRARGALEPLGPAATMLRALGEQLARQLT